MSIGRRQIYRHLGAVFIRAAVESWPDGSNGGRQAAFLERLREEMDRPDLSRHALWKWATGRSAVPFEIVQATVAISAGHSDSLRSALIDAVASEPELVEVMKERRALAVSAGELLRQAVDEVDP